MSLLTKLHAICGTLGLLLISGFFLSTIASELFGSTEQIVAVKTWILTLIPLLVLLLAGAGAGGNFIAKGRTAPEVGWKRLRMIAAGINGVFLLIPSAWVLQDWAAAGQFTGRFYGLQAVELLAGAANIALLYYNLRDGLRLRKSGKRR